MSSKKKAKEDKAKEEAAKRIQKKFREKRKKKQKKAVTKIQALARGRKVRAKVKKKKESTLQKRSRRLEERKKEREEEKKKNTATKKVQKTKNSKIPTYEKPNPIVINADTFNYHNNFIGSKQEYNHKFNYTEFPIFNSLNITKEEYSIFKKTYDLNEIHIPRIFGNKTYGSDLTNLFAIKKKRFKEMKDDDNGWPKNDGDGWKKKILQQYYILSSDLQFYRQILNSQREAMQKWKPNDKDKHEQWRLFYESHNYLIEMCIFLMRFKWENPSRKPFTSIFKQNTILKNPKFVFEFID